MNHTFTAIICFILSVLLVAQHDEYGNMLVNDYKGIAFVVIALNVMMILNLVLELCRHPNHPRKH